MPHIHVLTSVLEWPVALCRRVWEARRNAHLPFTPRDASREKICPPDADNDDDNDDDDDDDDDDNDDDWNGFKILIREYARDFNLS